MVSKLRVAVLGSIVALSAASASAGMQTWDFNQSTQSFSGTGNGNTLSLTSSDGVNLTVSAWSDTLDSSGADEIETARLHWATSSSLGIVNRDEDFYSPNHSVDSITDDYDGEYDMVLLEFDTAVNLTGIDLNWAVGGGSSNTADVSILAWDGSGSSSIVGDTWGGVLAGDYSSAGNYGGVGLSYYAVNPGAIESTSWLVGVYNPVFGAGLSAGNDGLKLASLTTETVDDPDPKVPVPGTLMLMLLGIRGLRVRKSLEVVTRT